MSGSSSATPTRLVGREAELALLTDRLDAARGGSGSVVVLRGEPGVGKTALIEQLIERAGDGVRVLRCRGVEAEVELPFSGLHELLRPLMGGVDELPTEQREALVAALSMVSEPASVVHASLAALTLVAEASSLVPLLVFADDLHWMDEATLLVLTFLARRISYDRVLLVAAERPGREESVPLGEVIELQPLAQADVKELVTLRAGDPLTSEVTGAIADATGGNPLAVIETVRLLGRNLDRIGTELDDPLPPGALIERGFASRLAGLAELEREALAVVAIAFTESAAVVARAIEHLGIPDDVLSAAEREGLMVRELDTVRFSHPLLRALVFHGTQPDRRRRVHAALAAVAADRGVRAWHAASACVKADAEVADELAEAALEFERRGGIVASSRALERAARITPDPLERARRLMQAAKSARLAGRARWSRELLDEALDLTGGDRSLELTVSIEIQRLSLAAHSSSAKGMLATLRELAAVVTSMSPTVACEVLSDLAYEAVLVRDAPTATKAIARAVEIVATADPSVHADIALLEAIVRMSTGEDPVGGLATLRETSEALVDGHAKPEVRVGLTDHWVILIAEYLWPFGEEQLCEQLLTKTMPRARARGDLMTLSASLGVLGTLQTRLGEWAAAEISFEQSLQLVEIRGFVWYRRTLAVRHANLLALRGDPAALAVPEALTQTAPADWIPFHDRLAMAHALYHLGGGNPAAAAASLQGVADDFEQGAMAGPTLTEWPALIVEAYALAGNPERAQHYLQEFYARWAAAPTAWSRATASMLRGLLAQDEDFEREFTEAIESFETTKAPFDLARTQLHFGRRLRRTGARARAVEQLTAALEGFERLGAPQWVAQASAELTAAGVTPLRTERAPSTLTSQERLVADLVATGVTNKEAAATLYLTPKTIEWHLRQIYRKLGIRSRTQLAAYLQGVER